MGFFFNYLYIPILMNSQFNCTKYIYSKMFAGHVPMRRLVYRVQPLPQSMLPLVWDFGQLTADVEKMYIRQMVLRCVCVKNVFL